MRKGIIVLLLLLLSAFIVKAQQVVVKTNLLSWTTLSPSAGIEFGLGRQLTADLVCQFNPWNLGANNPELAHWLVQPELRFWNCCRFERWFLGLHAHYGGYNLTGQLPFTTTAASNFRYKGFLYGLGISIGYHWAIGKRWGLEATLGAGYARLEYAKYSCCMGGEHIGDSFYNYFGPTKAGLSVIYLLK